MGKHKVIFAENLRTAGAIDMETPDGKRLRSHILGLSYFDSASGQSVLIAEIKNCIGQIVGSNQVVYSDAFDGIKADVRYTYTRASFEQDIILREQVPDPKEFGLNPGTTRLQVLTEFLNPPQPTIAARSIHRKNGEEIEDDTLDFGVMKFNDGKAFSAGKESGNISISKQWLNLDGRYRRRCRNKVRQFKFRSVDCEFAQLQYGALLHGDSHLH